MPNPPILIAGAGIAGLTLGRCLRKKDIPALIIERGSSSPRHNYGITLYPWAYRPLIAVLQMDEVKFRNALSVDANGHTSGAASGNAMSTSAEAAEGTFRCHRGRLEQLLREGLDIKWEHTIQGIEAASEGVRTDILRRESIQSKVVIGADGVHSQVRKSLAPHILLKVLPYVVFNGNRKLTLEEYQTRIEPQMRGYCTMQSRSNDVALQIAVNDFSATHVDVGYTYSRPAREGDPLHRPERPTSGASEIPKALYAELRDLKEVEGAFAEMFDADHVREDRLLHWLMRCTLASKQDTQELAKRGVLLVGDAVHAMPILGGEGGNTAMKDGVDLAEHIAAYGLQGIQSFLSMKHEMWKERVKQSKERLAEMHDTTKISM